MLILPTDKGFNHPLGSEITPREAYAGRRDMLRLMAGGAAGAALAGWAGRDAWAQTARPNKLAALPGAKSAVAGAVVMDKITDYKDASSYNNFYEFGTDKGAVGLAGNKTVIVALSRGGMYSTSDAGRSMEHQETYLQTVMGFMGVTDVRFVRAEGVGMGDAAKAQALQAADTEIRALTTPAANQANAVQAA